MMEIYSVGVRLALEDLVTVPLGRLAKQLEGMEGIVAGLNKSLKGLGAESLGIKEVAGASNLLDKHLAAANVQAARLEKNLAAIKALGLSGSSSTAMPVPLPYGGGRRGGGGYGGERGISVGPGGVGMSAATFGMGDMFVPLAIGAAGAYGVHSLYESAKDYQTEVARLTMFGLSQTQMKSAEAYVKGLKTQGTSLPENMRLFTEAQGVFRESGLEGEAALEGAKLATPWLAKIYYATEALDDASKASMRGSGMSMLRFIEQMGGVRDPATFNKFAEGGWKAIRASGGVVDWEQYRQFTARAGISGQYIDPDQLFGGLEPIIGELKGSTAGFSLRTAYNRLAGIIKVPNQVAHLLADTGVWDKSKIEWNSMGGIKRFNGNPLSAEENALLMHRPIDFYEKDIMPMYAKMNGGMGLSQEERARYNAMIFGSTGGNLFNKIDQQLSTLHKSMNAYNKTLGIDASTKVVDKTSSGAEAQFRAAWTDFKTEFGNSVLPDVTKMLKEGTTLLRSITAFHTQNKGLFDTIGTALKINPMGAVGAAVQGAWHHFTDDTKVVPNGGNFQPVQVHTQVNIDGRKVAEVVTKSQGRNMTRPPTGPSVHDGSMSPNPVGAGATGGW